jgi:uncharacterized damage-inducible protein DinB
MPRPQAGEYAPFYENYVSATVGTDVASVLNNSWDELTLWLGTIPEEKLTYSYAEGKWTVAQMLQHIIDCERIFAFRAMCIARGEKQSLPGFDENAYAEIGNAAHRSLDAIKKELIALRQATITLYNSFLPQDLQARGIASNNTITVNALGFILAGHILHHQLIYMERYC